MHVARQKIKRHEKKIQNVFQIETQLNLTEHSFIQSVFRIDESINASSSHSIVFSHSSLNNTHFKNKFQIIQKIVNSDFLINTLSNMNLHELSARVEKSTNFDVIHVARDSIFKHISSQIVQRKITIFDTIFSNANHFEISLFERIASFIINTAREIVH